MDFITAFVWPKHTGTISQAITGAIWLCLCLHILTTHLEPVTSHNTWRAAPFFLQFKGECVSGDILELLTAQSTLTNAVF